MRAQMFVTLTVFITTKPGKNPHFHCVDIKWQYVHVTQQRGYSWADIAANGA